MAALVPILVIPSRKYIRDFAKALLHKLGNDDHIFSHHAIVMARESAYDETARAVTREVGVIIQPLLDAARRCAEHHDAAKQPPEYVEAQLLRVVEEYEKRFPGIR